MYISSTKAATQPQKMVRGTVTLLSSISIRILEALPVRVAAVFFSR